MTDRRSYKGTSCTAVMGTLTNAQKAQKVLSSAAIPSSVTKSETSSSHRGCVWGINFSCNQLENIKAVLSSAGINVKSWSAGNDIFR